MAPSRSVEIPARLARAGETVDQAGIGGRPVDARLHEVCGDPVAEQELAAELGLHCALGCRGTAG